MLRMQCLARAFSHWGIRRDLAGFSAMACSRSSTNARVRRFGPKLAVQINVCMDQRRVQSLVVRVCHLRHALGYGEAH